MTEPIGPYILTLEGVADDLVVFFAHEVMRVAMISEEDIKQITKREDALGAINSIVLCAANNPLVLEEAEKASTTEPCPPPSLESENQN